MFLRKALLRESPGIDKAADGTTSGHRELAKGTSGHRGTAERHIWAPHWCTPSEYKTVPTDGRTGLAAQGGPYRVAELCLDKK